MTHDVTYFCPDTKGEAAMPTVICRCGWHFEIESSAGNGSARWATDVLLDRYNSHKAFAGAT